jgi:hypothetical protein
VKDGVSDREFGAFRMHIEDLIPLGHSEGFSYFGISFWKPIL